MFVKQHYLGKKSIKKPTPDGGEETIYAYTMGARAALEVCTRGPKSKADFDLCVSKNTVAPNLAGATCPHLTLCRVTQPPTPIFAELGPVTIQQFCFVAKNISSSRQLFFGMSTETLCSCYSLNIVQSRTQNRVVFAVLLRCLFVGLSSGQPTQPRKLQMCVCLTG